jgi:Lanthionine synthetase C-like protein
VLWRPTEHEPLIEHEWDRGTVEEAVGAIVADADAYAGDGIWPIHPLDELDDEGPQTSLYLGSAGMVWALHELGSRPERWGSALDLPLLLARALDRYRTEPGDGAHPPSLWMGETGLLVVAAKLGSPAADTGRLRELMRANREHPTWELMWGSPGTILAARACGLHDEWQDGARRLLDRWDAGSDLWTQHLYGRVQRFLGPAHGFAGDVHALRGYADDDLLRTRVTRVLDRHALRDGDLINWLPSVDPPEPLERIRVQWCHGAPGMIATLGDLMPSELALAGGELIWRAGPLRKGAGLCHGTAGNGYAFLRLFAVTGDERWLDRARRYAMHAIAQVDRERRLNGRGRYSLWTGDVGVAMYLRSCIRADPAFPTIDFW